MFSLPRHSVSTLGEFHSSIPSELFPFCVSFQSKKRKLKKSSKRKTPATEGGEGEGETTTSDSKVSEGSLVHVALRLFRTSVVITPHILQLLLF